MQPVAHAPHRLQQLRVRGGVLDLLPQAGCHLVYSITGRAELIIFCVDDGRIEVAVLDVVDALHQCSQRLTDMGKQVPGQPQVGAHHRRQQHCNDYHAVQHHKVPEVGKGGLGLLRPGYADPAWSAPDAAGRWSPAAGPASPATATGTTSIIRFERLSRSWIIITVPTFLV